MQVRKTVFVAYGLGMGIDFGLFKASWSETSLIERLRTPNCYTQGG